MPPPDREEGAGPSPGAGAGVPAAPGWLDDLGRLLQALRRMFGAQWDLLSAELGLARSAVPMLLAMALVATVFGVGLGLTLLGLLGALLAKWLGGWVAALAVLALVEVLGLVAAVLVFRRCLHWLSLPASRGEWGALIRDTLRKAKRAQASGEGPQT